MWAKALYVMCCFSLLFCGVIFILFFSRPWLNLPASAALWVFVFLLVAVVVVVLVSVTAALVAVVVMVVFVGVEFAAKQLVSDRCRELPTPPYYLIGGLCSP